MITTALGHTAESVAGSWKSANHFLCVSASFLLTCFVSPLLTKLLHNSQSEATSTRQRFPVALVHSSSPTTAISFRIHSGYDCAENLVAAAVPRPPSPRLYTQTASILSNKNACWTSTWNNFGSSQPGGFHGAVHPIFIFKKRMSH